MPVYIITGAGRGIGLGIAKTLAATASNTIIAAVRDPSIPSLQSLSTTSAAAIHILQLDQSSDTSVESFADKVAELTQHVDYLLNNAAVKLSPDSETPENLNKDDLLAQMTTNVYGPTIVTAALVKRGVVGKGSLVVNTTSGLASCANTKVYEWGHALGYALSKTCIDLLTMKQAVFWKDITFISLDPGWVKTDMGGPGAAMEIQSSVDAIIGTIHSRKHEHSGGFFLHDGQTLPF